MDLLWYAQENQVSVEETALAMDMSPNQVRNAFDDFTRKSRNAHYLSAAPLDMGSLGHPVPEAD